MSEQAAPHPTPPPPGLVSICIPVYNKAQHLRSVLEGILAQSYRNMEIVISDNASDDGSSDIARDFARQDSRIRHCRLEHTITLNENWRLVMRLANGEFCKLQSADDPLHPDFLAAMTGPMLQDPSIEFTVCREEPRFINVEGQIDTQRQAHFYKTSGDLCRELTGIADRKKRAHLLVQQNAFGNQLGNIYKVLFRPRCLPEERWRQISASYPMPQAFADWDFLIRLFLNHRGFFVDRVLTWFDYDPQSPFVKLQTNRQMQLAGALQEYLIPVTILTDPTLRALREWLSPQNREHILNFMSQSMRNLMAMTAEMDAIAKAAEGKFDV